MYLTKKRYVKNWDFEKGPKWKVTVKKGTQEIKSKMPIQEVVYEAGYWRKANAIHQWFVQNVQDGEDDCREYHVSKEQLRDLLDKCLEVLARAEVAGGKIQNGTAFKDGKAEPIMQDGKYIKNAEEIAKILPTAGGFFFGSTDYNEWYLDDIKLTVEIINKCLDEPDGDFYYQSSW